MSIITLLILVLIACVVIWATRALLAAFSVPDPIATVILVVVILLVLVAFLNQVGLVNLGTLRLG